MDKTPQHLEQTIKMAFTNRKVFTIYDVSDLGPIHEPIVDTI